MLSSARATTENPPELNGDSREEERDREIQRRYATHVASVRIMRRIAEMQRRYLFEPLRDPSLVRLEAELLGVRGCKGRGTS